jgi:hypothetical protein
VLACASTACATSQPITQPPQQAASAAAAAQAAGPSSDATIAEGPAPVTSSLARRQWLGAAAATALNLRNGQNVLAPIKWDLEAEATVSTVLVLPRPVLFEFGIFADVDANILSAIVFFEYVSAVPHSQAPPDVIEEAP